MEITDSFYCFYTMSMCVNAFEVVKKFWVELISDRKFIREEPLIGCLFKGLCMGVCVCVCVYIYIYIYIIFKILIFQYLHLRAKNIPIKFTLVRKMADGNLLRIFVTNWVIYPLPRENLWHWFNRLCSRFSVKNVLCFAHSLTRISGKPLEIEMWNLAWW